MKGIDSRPFFSPQPFWAELLSGKPWFELDCPGYAKPVSTLDNLEIISEDHLSCDLPLLGVGPQGALLLVNMPLVKPKPGRFWLSDGSFPLQMTFYPRDLARSQLLRDYKPRPFPSTTSALADRSAGILSSLLVERQRIDCTIELLREKHWDTVFMRISVFDLLAHLIGADFLQAEKLTAWGEINEFLTFFSRALTEIFELAGDSDVIAVSSFSHVPCQARLNLNLLLEQAGFCQLQDKSHDARLVASGRRADAVRILNWADDAPPNVRPMVSKTNSFDLQRTVACSPIQGAVYLNRSDRFKHGTVENSEIPALSGKVTMYLTEALRKEFGQEIFLWQPECGEQAVGPELMIYMVGVEIHNSAELPVVDRINRPRSTHLAEGFALLPNKSDNLPAVLKALDLHRFIREKVLCS